MPRYRTFLRNATQGPPPSGGSEFARREALTIGSYKPDTTNTGLLNDPDRPLTVWEGDYTANVPGATVKDLEIRGRVFVTAANVTIDNCWIRGPAARIFGINTGLVVVGDNGLNALIRDCFLEPRAPSSSLDGLRYCGYTALRVRVARTTDGFGAFPQAAGLPANVKIFGCIVESLTKFCPDSDAPGTHTNGTHNDTVQIQGGVGVDQIIIRGSVLNGYLDPNTGDTGGMNTNAGCSTLALNANGKNTQTNATLQLNHNVGILSGIRIEDNWLYGGSLAINGLAITDAVNLGIFQRNRFNRDTYFLPATAQSARIAAGPTVTWPTSGPDVNIFEDDNSIVPLNRA